MSFSMEFPPLSPNPFQDTTTPTTSCAIASEKMRDESSTDPTEAPADSEMEIQVQVQIPTQTQEQSRQKAIVDANIKRRLVVPSLGFASSFASGIVKLLIDTPAWPFHLHITPLQQSSRFFLDSLYPAGTRTIQTLALPELKLEPFELFIEYVYTHDYTIPIGRDFHACWLHAQVYFLGSKIGADGLRRLACEKLKKTLGGGEIQNEVPVGAVVRLVRGVYEQQQRERKMVRFSDWGWEKENGEPEDEEEDEDEGMGESNAALIPSLTLGTNGGSNNNNTSADGFKDADDLKVWVIRYIAHKIEKFRVSPDFKGLVEEHRDFAFDLLCVVSSGPPLDG